MKVFVYYNLHKHCWSVKALEGDNKGRVVAHADTVLVYAAQPRVSQRGRERVLRTKQKNVHAGIVGWVNLDNLSNGYTQKDIDGWVEITYNPYLYTGFVVKSNPCEMFVGLADCYMSNRKVFHRDC